MVMKLRLVGLCAAVALVPLGASVAQAPAAPKPYTSEAVAPNVMASLRSWVDGDEAGRRDLERLAASGRDDAREALAEALNAGAAHIAQDRVKACGYFDQASATRRDALHSKAVCLEDGVLGHADASAAAQIYGQAAQLGFPKSMCALGNLYLEGRGVAKDRKKGTELCKQGAELGDADAQTDLGNIYLKGEAVPRDMVQARRWYEKAAAQHQRNAEFLLGQIYWNGDHVTSDRKKAAAFLKAAYEDGRVDAAALLSAWAFAGWMSAHPAGDLTELDEAVLWAERAVAAAEEPKAKAEAGDTLTFIRGIRTAAVGKNT